MKSKVEPGSEGKVIVVKHHPENVEWKATLLNVDYVFLWDKWRTRWQIITVPVKPIYVSFEW
jgi:hypothetical protein